MGGAVSSGRDNNELVDNLIGSNYIRSRGVELVFRALDRANYMVEEARDQAYKDLAWRHGPLHLSAPCIYSEVMESLDLQPGMSFLNIGSGTGYLSTLAGLMIGPSGVNHGVEVSPTVVDYANQRLNDFLQENIAVDEFEFCVPKFFVGNALCLSPLQAGYDRVYCGAGCPEQYQNYMKQLIKVGGVLVMPLLDSLLRVRRDAPAAWTTRSVLSVSFAPLREPGKAETQDPLKLEDIAPPPLRALSRGLVRARLRRRLLQLHAELRPPPAAPRGKRPGPRSICIPVDDDSDNELNELHDLDRAGGAHEMNALLSLVLSMGQNHVAGAIRFDPVSSDSESSGASPPRASPPPSPPPPDHLSSRDLDIVADVIRRAAGRGDARPAAPPPRGRLSLTLEYNDSASPPRGPRRRDSRSPSSRSEGSDDADSDDERRNLRKRYLRCSLDDMPRRGAGAGAGAGQAAPGGAEPASQAKRQKFDSGLGDESGPSDESGGRKSDSDSEREPASPQGRPEADDDDDDDDDEEIERPAPRRAGAASRRRGRAAGEARRRRLAALLRDAIRALPLPRLYKRYLDFCRANDI